LKVYTGDITQLKGIDMVVCGETYKGGCEGQLAKRLMEVLGKVYKKEKKSKFKDGVAIGEVVVCKGSLSGSQLTVGWVAHAVLHRTYQGDEDRRKKVEAIYMKIFSEAVQHKCTDIAMPLLGSGIYVCCSYVLLMCLPEVVLNEMFKTF